MQQMVIKSQQVHKEYRLTGNICVNEFSRNFAVNHQSMKINIRKIISYFSQISVEELVASMVAVCGTYCLLVSIVRPFV